MERIIVAGPNAEGIADALADAGCRVTRIDGPVTADALESAGIDAADAFVLTDPGEATAIPLAREAAPNLTILVYATDRLPPFASHLADLIIHPRAIDRAVVIEELLGILEMK